MVTVAMVACRLVAIAVFREMVFGSAFGAYGIVSASIFGVSVLQALSAWHGFVFIFKYSS